MVVSLEYRRYSGGAEKARDTYLGGSYLIGIELDDLLQFNCRRKPTADLSLGLQLTIAKAASVVC